MQFGSTIKFISASEALKIYSQNAEFLLAMSPLDYGAINRAELSQQPTKVRERGMRRLKSTWQAHRFLSSHAEIYNLFNLGRHLISAKHYRIYRLRAFASWKGATD